MSYNTLWFRITKKQTVNLLSAFNFISIVGYSWLLAGGESLATQTTSNGLISRLGCSLSG